MDFSKIDFGAISRMLDSMSDEEKQKINDMAQSMMNQNAQEDEEDQPIDFYAFLGINEEKYADLPGMALDQIEAASDLEQFYDDDHTVDFSASILFYAKAILTILRKTYFPVFKNLFSGFTMEQTSTIAQYLSVLENESNIDLLVNEGFLLASQWNEMKNLLRTWLILLNRAEFDTISYQDLQMAKQSLFDQDYLLTLHTMY